MAAKGRRVPRARSAGPGLRPAIGVAALVALVATLIDLGPFHRVHGGDTIVPVLMSLYRWELFMWEQDRVGMLVPLLTSGLHHPLHNLLAQVWLSCFTALLGFYALAWIAVGARGWIVVGSMAVVTSLATGSEDWRFWSLMNHGPALMALGAAVGLAGGRLTPPRFLGSALLSFLGAWVNTGAAFIVVPALVLRGLMLRGNADAAAPRSRAGIVTGLAIAAFLVSLWLSTLAPVRQDYRILPAAEWLACWAGLVTNAWREGLVSGSHLAVLGALAAAGGIVTARARGAGLRNALGALIPLGAAAVCLLLVMGTINWTKSQGLSARYLIPAVVALDVAFAGFFVAAVVDRVSERVRARAQLASPIAFAVIAAAIYFPPSLAGVRGDIDRKLGPRTQEILEHGITHVAGSYWTVWPTVFHANLVLYEQGSDRKVWGLAHRAAPTVDQWGRIPLSEWRVAAIPEEFEDPWTATVYGRYGLPPLRPIGRLKTFTVFVPEPQAPR